MPGNSKRQIRFGDFEVDLTGGELRKNGRPVRLQDQPFRILKSLLERPGELVSREELREEIWGDDVYVDFDRSLNTSVARLREALGDSPTRPVYVETVPRKGYRFMYPLEAGASTTDETTEPAQSKERALKRKLALHRFLLAVTGAVALCLAFVHFGETPPEANAPLRRFAITPPEAIDNTGFGASVGASVAISPNGKHIAFTTARSQTSLWVRDLDQQEPRAIEGGQGARQPFWSASSDSIAFAAGGEIRKVSPQGGLTIPVCRIPGEYFSGGTWSPDGEVIVFSSGPPFSLYEVPSSGGTPSLLVSGEGAEGSRGALTQPHFLPSEAGARVVLYTAGALGAAVEMIVHDLETNRRDRLGPGAAPFYSRSGHILYQLSGLAHEVWARPFPLDTLKARGEAFPISENSRDPTVAADGTLVYIDSSSAAGKQLVWLDRDGNKTGEIGEARQDVFDPVLSPDGRLVAVAATEGSDFDLWILDIGRGVRTRLSTSPNNEYGPVWSPSGEEVAFYSARDGDWDILVHQSDGGGEAEVLLSTPNPDWVSDWSRDGRHVLYHVTDPNTGDDLWYLERKEDGSGWEQHSFLQTPFNEFRAMFSPDGRYVAYTSDESGKDEVYVRPFPEGGPKLTVSRNGGNQPRWARAGKELFYVEGTTLIAVSISSEPTLSVRSTSRLFDHSSLTRSDFPQYDVSDDAQRFVLAEQLEGDNASIHVVQNWYEEFRDRKQD